MRIIEWEHLTEEPEELEEQPEISRLIPIMMNQSPINNQTFDMYVGHTNFRLNKKKDAELLNAIEGIEVLRVLTRYRFVIAIGECFNFAQISREIEDALGCFAKPEKNIPEEIMHQIIRKAEELSEKSDFWCFYVFPNGAVNWHVLDNVDELLEQLKIYDKCKSLSDGIIIWPNDIEIPEGNEFSASGAKAKSE